MRHRNPTLVLLLLPFTAIIFVALLFSSDNSATSQTRDKRLNSNGSPNQKVRQNQNSNDASSTPTPATSAEVVKVDVDLVKVDALVLQKKTARAVSGLNKEDFLLGGWHQTRDNAL